VAFVLSLSVLHLMLPAVGLAQVNVGNANIGAGGTVTGPILFPDGTEAAPAISYAGAPTKGFWRTAGNVLAYNTSAGVATVAWSSSQTIICATCIYAWSQDADPELAVSDTRMTRESAAVIQLGSDVNGAAVSQTVKAPDGITGTDRTGGNLTVGPGNGTGAGAVSAFIVATPTVLGSGTTAQTWTTRLTVTSAGAVATVPVTSSTDNMGWSIVAGANTACTTTCTFGAVFGWDGTTPVGPTSALADTCLCAGAN